MKVKPHCFWCEHLILDGCASWCEIHRAGELCDDYVFNDDRYTTVKKYEKKYKNKDKP